MAHSHYSTHCQGRPLGIFITAPVNNLCVINGIKTLVQGDCPSKDGRRLVSASSAPVSANGGGLAIYGTATLTDTNVYANQAGLRVCSHFDIS
eukprot:scaffold82090_cov67-Phaeocystis_antarctica.AAC.2